MTPTLHSAPCVIITRPAAQAGPLAQQVAALGRPVQLLPLLEIHSLPDNAALIAALACLADYAMVAFVSPNAIDAALAHVTAWPVGVTLAVLGEGSRLALAGHGITAANATIVSPPAGTPSDSEHLLQTLDLERLRGQRVLIVRGESGRELMGEALRAAGVHVTTVAAYRRSVPQLNASLAATLQDVLTRSNDWIITSSEALRGLLALLRQIDDSCAQSAAVVKMQHQHLIVPHARIAQIANELGFRHVTLTGSGDTGVLAALQLLS